MRTTGTQIFVVNPNTVIVVQSRVGMILEKVTEYTKKMQEGVVFDACSGVYEASTGRIYVWDGCHRVEAAMKTGIEITIETTPGTKTDAEWLSLTANAKHGIPRTHEDIARIAKHALLHPYAAHMTNADIARHCGMSDNTIRKYRKELEASSQIAKIEKREVIRKGKRIMQKATRDGRKKAVDVTRCLFCQHSDVVIKPTLDPKRGICLQCAMIAVRELATTPCELCKTSHPHCVECCVECEQPCNAQQVCRKGRSA